MARIGWKHLIIVLSISGLLALGALALAGRSVSPAAAATHGAITYATATAVVSGPSTSPTVSSGIQTNTGNPSPTGALPFTGGAEPTSPNPMLPLGLVGLAVVLIGVTLSRVRRR